MIRKSAARWRKQWFPGWGAVCAGCPLRRNLFGLCLVDKVEFADRAARGRFADRVFLHAALRAGQPGEAEPGTADRQHQASGKQPVGVGQELDDDPQQPRVQQCLGEFQSVGGEVLRVHRSSRDVKSRRGCGAGLLGGLCPVFIPVPVKDSVDVGFPGEIRDQVPWCLFNPLGLGLIAEPGRDFIKGSK